MAVAGREDRRDDLRAQRAVLAAVIGRACDRSRASGSSPRSRRSRTAAGGPYGARRRPRKRLRRTAGRRAARASATVISTRASSASGIPPSGRIGVRALREPGATPKIGARGQRRARAASVTGAALLSVDRADQHAVGAACWATLAASERVVRRRRAGTPAPRPPASLRAGRSARSVSAASSPSTSPSSSTYVFGTPSSAASSHLSRCLDRVARDHPGERADPASGSTSAARPATRRGRRRSARRRCWRG